MGGSGKLNGRPKLSEGKRSKKIDVRFTVDEYRLVQDMEKELGLSKTELIRMRVLNDGGKVVINSRELLKHLDGIGAELGRSGNNINQLAKYANTLRLKGHLAPYVVTTFNELMDGYIRVQQQLEAALRKVIKLMSN